MFDPSGIPTELRIGADPRLARIEEAGLNAAQPAEQLLVDGWLLRFSPGKARRARSVNAISAGRLPLEEKIELCRRHYRHVQLPLLFRITPFSQPRGLDDFLRARGFEAFDQTRVMTRALDDPSGTSARFVPVAMQVVDVPEFACVVGALRGSPRPQIDAHERRLLASALRQSTVRRVARVGDEPVAAGQVVMEGDSAGLYDIVTATSWRGRGLGRAISAQLLADAATRGAQLAYLQVDAGNEPARHVYAALGFVDRYAYWYRREAGANDDLMH